MATLGFDISVAPTNLLMIASGSSIVSVSDPELTIPPPPSGGQSSFVLDLSNLISPQVAVSPTTGMSWSSPNVNVTGTFQNGTVTITDNDNSAINAQFTIVQNGNAPAATTTNLTVNTDNSFFATSIGTGVQLTDGVVSLVTCIPAGGQVQVTNPVFFVTSQPSGNNPTENDSFSLTGASTPSAVTLGNITAGAGLSVASDTVTVSSWSSLNNSLVTVPFTVNGTNGSSGFIVTQSARGAGTVSPTSVQLNSDGTYLVTALGSDVFFTGLALQYQTIAAGSYGFSYDGAGVPFNGTDNLSFSGGSQPLFITNLNQASSGDSFTDTNTAGLDDSAVFTIATAEGTLDPTILNNPDT